MLTLRLWRFYGFVLFGRSFRLLVSLVLLITRVLLENELSLFTIVSIGLSIMGQLYLIQKVRKIAPQSVRKQCVRCFRMLKLDIILEALLIGESRFTDRLYPIVLPFARWSAAAAGDCLLPGGYGRLTVLGIISCIMAYTFE